jgi:hypothetical protein
MILSFVRRNWLFLYFSGGRDDFVICPEELTIPIFFRRKGWFCHFPGGTISTSVRRNWLYRHFPGETKENKEISVRIFLPPPPPPPRRLNGGTGGNLTLCISTMPWRRISEWDMGLGESWRIYDTGTGFVACDFISCIATLTQGLCERLIELKWQT